DMAFPRLNALSYWLYLFSGIFLYVGVPLGQAPNGGWFNYVPYTNRDFDPGINIDIFSLGLIFLGISTVVGSANFVVTLLRTRAPGMSINRLPIMVIGFGVWVHHMFATGLPAMAISFFSAASIIIAIPSAIAVFAWIATIWTGRPVFKTPFLFFAGFVILFVIGGVSGFMTASAA